MKIGKYEIQPIAPYLPDEPKWVERDNKAKEYFAQEGITDVHWVPGIHAEAFGIAGTHIYLLDNRPEEKHMIGPHKVAGYLTNYMMYAVMDAMPSPYFMYLETDCRFKEGWREGVEKALEDIPEDFDYLFVGSCCAKDKQPILVKDNLYHFPYRGINKWYYYPVCAHCMIIAKKAVPTILATQRDCANPADIGIMRYAFPKLKVYAILPRLADQGPTYIIPD